MWWIILAGVLVLGGALWGPIVSNVEQPKYKVFATEKNIQIRDYAPMIVAETQVPPRLVHCWLGTFQIWQPIFNP